MISVYLLVIGAAVIAQYLFVPHFLPEFHFGANTSVEGKTVLVTGASLGIGRSLVEEYARDGAAAVVMVARSVEKMQATRDRIYREKIASRETTKIYVIGADLSSKDACEGAVEQALEYLGDRGLDYLVLNHITNSRFGTWLEDNYALPGGHDFVPEMFATNTFSYMWMTTAAIDALHAASGRIVVVSSLAGWLGPPKNAVYSATKHALHGFFDSLRSELKMMQNGKYANIGITIASLGAHETEGAAQVKQHINEKMVQWVPAVTAARKIVTGAAANKDELFHPHLLVWPMIAARPFVPKVLDYILSLAYVV